MKLTPALHLGRWRWSFLSLAMSVALLACSGPQVRTDVALIYLTSTPADAVVLIDDVAIGRVSDLQEHVTVPAGGHRMEVRAPGYMSYRADLVLVGGESYGLIIELWPLLDELDE